MEDGTVVTNGSQYENELFIDAIALGNRPLTFAWKPVPVRNAQGQVSALIGCLGISFSGTDTWVPSKLDTGLLLSSSNTGDRTFRLFVEPILISAGVTTLSQVIMRYNFTFTRSGYTYPVIYGDSQYFDNFIDPIIEFAATGVATSITAFVVNSTGDSDATPFVV